VILELVDGAVTSELRRAVLRPTWAPGTAMHGDGETGVLHVAARSDVDGAVIGACVLLPRPYPLRPEALAAWQLRGMATDPDWRNRGVGQAVLDHALAELARRGAELVWCQARETAIQFYARHGFAAEGDRFDHAETGIVHQLMWRAVPVLEPID